MLNRLPLPLFAVGLAGVYLGERALAATSRMVVAGLGGALLFAAFVLALWRWMKSTAERRRAHGWVVVAYGVCLGALGVYALQTQELDWTAGKGRVLMQVAWPGILLLGLMPAVAMELAIGTMERTPTLEIWRVRLASRAARIVALAIVAFAGVNFTANTWNRKIDLSYFKTTRVGTATQAVVKNLSQPVKFILFFPPGNDVLQQARTYVDELVHSSNQVTVEVTDQALEPDRARELNVRSNGYLVVQSAGKNETLRLDLDAEEARATLRNLDSEIHRRLLKVIRPSRVVYLTTGHMERDYAPAPDDKRPGLGDLKSLILEPQGFTVRRLGLGEGLGSEIPKDATVVMVFGPQENFSAAERGALHRYLEGGGRALFAMDPDHGVTDDALLAPLGVKVSKSLIANERYLVRLEGHGESPYDLGTNRSSTHPVVMTMEQFSQRFWVGIFGAGTISRTDSAPTDVNISFALHAMPNSWEDKNGNGKFDVTTEQRGSYEFVAAVEKVHKAAPVKEGEKEGDKDGAKEGDKAPEPPPMRAVVVSDADFATNGIVRNMGNAYLLNDSLRWLAGDEQNAGIIESEKDVPLVHRKDEDAVWFYGTSFMMPALVLVGGMLATRRAGRARRAR